MIKIIGLGNPLYGDDAFGLYVIEELKKSGVEKGGCHLAPLPTPSPWDIYEVLRGGEFFLIIDAMEEGEEGKIEIFSIDELGTVENKFRTIHDVNINQVVDLLRLNGFAVRGLVVAVRGYSFSLSLELSPEMKPLVKKVSQKLIEMLDQKNFQQ